MSATRSARPLVGVTAHRREVEGSPGSVRSQLVHEHDLIPLTEAGALPVLLPISAPEAAAGLLARLDGLVLTGGGDVDPRRYGAGDHPAVYGVDPTRDVSEIALILAAQASGLPVLAVCRGAQVANVALGGSLIPDLDERGHPGHSQRGQASFKAFQRLRVEPSSLLAKASGAEELMVNSIHHQAVDVVADGLVSTAWSAEDGVVEAVEWAGDDWLLLGVQWHPEYLYAAGDEHAARLYRWFTERLSLPYERTSGL